MRYRKNRRHRHRSNDRGRPFRVNGGDQVSLRSSSGLNDRMRGNNRSHQSAEKLVEKYNALAKEAKSSGDKILSENYFQHADHFMRVVDEKNLNQARAAVPIKKEEPNTFDKSSNKTSEISNDKGLVEKKE